VVVLAADGRQPQGAALDSARQNLAATFVNAFVNAGFGNDKLVTPPSEASGGSDTGQLEKGLDVTFIIELLPVMRCLTFVVHVYGQGCCSLQAGLSSSLRCNIVGSTVVNCACLSVLVQHGQASAAAVASFWLRAVHWIFKNKEHGKTSATASLGLISLWDVEGGLPLIDKYLYSSDNAVVAGALLAIGLVNCGVQNENDPGVFEDVLVQHSPGICSMSPGRSHTAKNYCLHSSTNHALSRCSCR